MTNEYVFHDGKRTYAVRKASSARAVSALASHLRNYADAAMKGGAMTSLPLNQKIVNPK